MKRHAQYAVALVALVVGAGGALLASLPTWQVVSVPRAKPLADVVVEMTGRDVDSAITALGVVALAGVVAVLATRGRWRQVVGAVLALAGVGLVLRAVLAVSAVDAARARSFVESHRETVDVAESVRPRIDVTVLWPVLSIACGLIVVAAGALIAARGAHWQAMSSRYEPVDAAAAAPVEPEVEEARAAATMWSALDRGEDPTSR